MREPLLLLQFDFKKKVDDLIFLCVFLVFLFSLCDLSNLVLKKKKFFLWVCPPRDAIWRKFPKKNNCGTDFMNSSDTSRKLQMYLCAYYNGLFTMERKS